MIEKRGRGGKRTVATTCPFCGESLQEGFGVAEHLRAGECTP